MRNVLKVLVTGAAGQDGKILSQALLQAQHEIIMLCRPQSSKTLADEFPKAQILGCDLTNFEQLELILNEKSPDTIVNLAAFSSVKESWSKPEEVKRINSGLPEFLFDWARKRRPETHLVQASSSEIFGSVSEEPQNEKTNLRPLTPYGHSKAIAHQLGSEYRDKYALKISNVILYNHESLNRPVTYVTRHISMGVASILLGQSKVIRIGNLRARRDWGWAPDYMSGIKQVVERRANSDFLFATGQTFSVEEVLHTAFESIGISNISGYIELAQDELRMADPVNLRGDATKAKKELGWSANLLIPDFIPLMVAHDIDVVRTTADQEG
jgi:GDPmannose 4,6-dehydratase